MTRCGEEGAVTTGLPSERPAPCPPGPHARLPGEVSLGPVQITFLIGSPLTVDSSLHVPSLIVGLTYTKGSWWMVTIWGRRRPGLDHLPSAAGGGRSGAARTSFQRPDSWSPSKPTTWRPPSCCSWGLLLPSHQRRPQHHLAAALRRAQSQHPRGTWPPKTWPFALWLLAHTSLPP